MKFMHASIVLCGFMGSGKSKLGQLLAGLRSLRFEDLDEEIQKYEGLGIPEIFAQKGEAYFRQAERTYLCAKAADQNRVLSLGGGALQSQDMVDRLKSSNLLVFLDPPLHEIIRRVQKNHRRPLLLNPDGTPKTEAQLQATLNDMLKVRRPYYAQAHTQFQPDPDWSPLRSATELNALIDSHVNTL